MRKLIFFFIVLFVTGCGTAKTIVLEPPKASGKFQHIQILSHNPTVDLPVEVAEVFEGELRKQLYESGKFKNGEDLKLFYTFVSHEEGSRFARWFWGGLGNMGEASITIQVLYMDKNETELAKTLVEGKIGSGLFGGSINEAIIKTAQDVAEFTIHNFALKK